MIGSMHHLKFVVGVNPKTKKFQLQCNSGRQGRVKIMYVCGPPKPMKQGTKVEARCQEAEILYSSSDNLFQIVRVRIIEILDRVEPNKIGVKERRNRQRPHWSMPAHERREIKDEDRFAS
jgi:hypothetical protein